MKKHHKRGRQDVPRNDGNKQSRPRARRRTSPQAKTVPAKPDVVAVSPSSGKAAIQFTHALGNGCCRIELEAGEVLGLFGLWAERQRRELSKLQEEVDAGRDLNAVLAQSIEVGRELLKALPHGGVAEPVYRAWLKQSQTAGGIIDAVSAIVADHVDNESARAVADLLTTKAGKELQP